MFNHLTLLFLILLGGIAQAQTNFFHQFNQSLPQLNVEQQIDTIIAIPFEVMNSQGVKTIEKYEYALQLSNELKDDYRIGCIYEKMGLAYYYLGDYDVSVLSMNKAIEAFEKVNNQVRIGSTYASIGHQMKRRNLSKAFEYMHKGIDILETTDDKIALSAAYNNIGVLYQMKEDVDSALYYFYLGYDIVKAENDSLGIPYSLNNIGQALVDQNKYDQAFSKYEEAFEIRKIRNDQNGLAENYGYLGDLYFKKREFDKAIKNYLQSLKISEEINYPYLCQTNSDQLAKTYEEIGDYQQALVYRKKNQKYKDEILNETSNKTIAHLEVQFDTERKEKELAIKSANVLQEKSKVRQRTFILIGLSISLFLLLLIGILIYRQLKLKQKHLQNENQLKDIITEEETKNKIYSERMRISRDLHDNIGSQLTFLISSMDNMKYVSDEEKLKFKLSDLTSFTRGTISQLRDTIWAMNKTSLSIEDLQVRIEEFLELAQNSTEGIKFTFVKDIKSIDYEFTPNQGVNLFRILQESINNAVKYAAASHIEIQMYDNKNEIIFRVKDNGKGFTKEDNGQGFGIRNMKARALEIDADYDLKTELNKGTEITVSFQKNTQSAV
ncbi:tetratricopeptide repeat-containing sensor histidine kinase [Brumimicrobium sp.]|uniref:tetratricopeptide repeat-containing sensor histidine kinase n=1 Tax=Brumimicrobium sp. TaxID=2029867 RepID=UPI003A9517BE